MPAVFIPTGGVPWPESWMNTDANGILSPITAKSILAGGHEVFIIDYDLTQNLFLCQNSWGTGWGKAGRFYMPMAPFDGIFQSLGGYDAFYMTAKWGTPTPTPPPPTPPPPTPPPAPTLVSLSISPMPASLLVGASLQLTASGKYSDGSVKNLTTQVAWKANNNLVTINASGFVMGVTPGTSTITATLGLIIGGDLVTVIAPTPTPPPPTPPPPSTSNFVRLLESADGKNWNFVFQRNVPSTAQFMLESSPDGKNWNILYQGEIKVKHEEEKK